MGAFLIAFKTILPLFLIILAGIAFSKTKVATPEWIDVLNKYAIWIGLPSLVLNSLIQLNQSVLIFANLIWINSVYIILCIILAYPVSALFGYSNQRRRTMFLVFAYGNVAYLGIPVLQSVLGDSALPEAALLSAVYVFWLVTLGVILVEVHGTEKMTVSKTLLQIIKNPLLISVFLGIALAVLQVKLPVPVEKSLSMLAGSVTAIVLFSLGIFLGFQKFGHWRDWYEVTFFVALILLIIPGIYYLLLRQFDIPGFNLTASVLDAAMPLGLTAYALTHQFQLDTAFAARIVVLSTLLSIVILPLWIVILSY